MGRWFYAGLARDRKKIREEARALAEKKKTSAYEVLFIESGERRFYAGDELPKHIQKGIGKTVHVLRYWRPEP